MMGFAKSSTHPTAQLEAAHQRIAAAAMSILVELAPELYSITAFDRLTTAPGFDLGTARALMWMSKLAYETAESGTIEYVCPRWRLDRTTPFFRRARSRAA